MAVAFSTGIEEFLTPASKLALEQGAADGSEHLLLDEYVKKASPHCPFC